MKVSYKDKDILFRHLISPTYFHLHLHSQFHTHSVEKDGCLHRFYSYNHIYIYFPLPTMKFVALFGILPLLAAAAPTQRDSGSFTAISGDGCPEVDHKPLQAAGQKFWLGGEPGTYCPTFVNPNCPPGNVTAFAGPYALVCSVRSYRYLHQQ